MSGVIEIKSAREVDDLRVACQMAAETMLLVGERLRPGMTTDDINTLVHEDTLRRGGRPSPLNYHGFPKSVCTSVNEVVCHGIPGPQKLRNGDIVTLAVGGGAGYGNPADRASSLIEADTAEGTISSDRAARWGVSQAAE